MIGNLFMLVARPSITQQPQTGVAIQVGDWFSLMNLLIPAIVSVIVKPEWSNSVKYLVAFGVSCLAALGQVLMTERPSDFFAILLKTFILVMGSYAAFWRPTGLAQKIEEKINP